MSKISILHISDLHRSKDREITNEALLTSLLNDRDHYTTESPLVKAPDIIIVSGDVIRGSGDDDTGKEIKRQYDQALAFMNELTDQFLDGDKSRIIIIPGNHDIDWKYSKESMAKVDPEQYKDNQGAQKRYLKNAINEQTKIRWSWNDLSFYEIKEEEVYGKRLEAFATFYSAFYEGKRNYPLNPTEQYDIFDIPEFEITVLALNSCFNNDHLKTMGDINPVCLAAPYKSLKEFRKKGRLLLATWHHNTKGLPYAFDYMDSSKMKNLIDLEVPLGFHGHQHKTEIINEFNNIMDQKRIVVFSAGTLCSGPEELPTGHNRQYNIVELQKITGSTKIKVTLHTREKTSTSSFENPIWAPGRIDSTNNSSFSTEIDAPSRPLDTGKLLEAESFMKVGQFSEAVHILTSLDLADPFVRNYLGEALVATEDYNAIIKHFDKPENNTEATYLMAAALESNNKETLKMVAAIPFIKDNKDSAVVEMKQKIELKLK